MRLEKIKLNNFRGFKGDFEILLTDLTAFVGKNDVGKSSILEALDIFFNDKEAFIKIDKDDLNKFRFIVEECG